MKTRTVTKINLARAVQKRGKWERLNPTRRRKKKQNLPVANLVRGSPRSRNDQWLLVLKLCGNQRVDGVGRLRFDVRTGLKADEAEWKKRDVHTRHETATLEIGKAVAWHYAPVGKPGELWFRFGVIVDIIGGKLKVFLSNMLQLI